MPITVAGQWRNFTAFPNIPRTCLLTQPDYPASAAEVKLACLFLQIPLLLGLFDVIPLIHKGLCSGPFNASTAPSNAGESISVHSCSAFVTRDLYCNFASHKA